MKKFIAIALLLCVSLSLFAACAAKEPAAPSKPKYPRLLGEAKSTDTYVENELYLWNEETQRKFNCREVVPKNLADGEKVPMIVYVHGGTGNALSLVNEPETLAADKIAGFTIECCGGNKNALSDGKDIFPSNYTSRVSDLEAAIAYVKTLPYVDTDKLYIYGQSYGGLVAMAAAPMHNDDTAGMILESTGMNEDGSIINTNPLGVVEKYSIPADWQSFINQYNKDIIICCAVGDEGGHANGLFTSTVYAQRETGSVTFYSCPEGAHAFNSFSEEGKQITYDAIREMVLGK